jgi:hypothetical protein
MIVWMAIAATAVVAIPAAANSADFVVYSVYRGLDLGNPGEAPPPKDFYVNAGSTQGVHVGSVLEVLRKVPTYDLQTEKLYKDITFPIARIKVIHAENNASVARLEKMLPPDKSPATTPYAVMVGDLVRME